MKKNKKELKKDRAITLIALVVTMIILLILAGVTVGLATNQTGLFEKAKLATDEYNNKTKQEETELTKMANEIDNNYIGGNREIADTTPVGTVISCIRDSAPSGYLACDGTEYDISQYPNLAEELRKVYNGYNTTNEGKFKVPDLRGEFLRGTGNNADTSQGNGSNIGEHQKATTFAKQAYAIDGNGGWSLVRNSGQEEQVDSAIGGKTLYNFKGNGSSSNSGIIFTARPTNTSVLYCIKY